MRAGWGEVGSRSGPRRGLRLRRRCARGPGRDRRGRRRVGVSGDGAEEFALGFGDEALAEVVDAHLGELYGLFGGRKSGEAHGADFVIWKAAWRNDARNSCGGCVRAGRSLPVVIAAVSSVPVRCWATVSRGLRSRASESVGRSLRAASNSVVAATGSPRWMRATARL